MNESSARWIGATKPFAREDAGKTWRLLGATLLLAGLCLALLCAAPRWYLKAPFALLFGLIQIRAFAFYHDYLHGAVLRGSDLARVIIGAIGVYLMAVPSVWRETHDYHHAHNSKLAGSSIGSFPVVSLATWSEMDARQRARYRRARHPLTILFGYVTVFIYGMNVAPFIRHPRRHWAGPVALLLHALWVASVGRFFGAATALGVVAAMALCHALGAYLFFAQHNFAGSQFQGRSEWSHASAALHASSMFEMSSWMHWFTGNIGYHHVHHLNHRIPFYELPNAMAAIEELRAPHRTSWRLRDIQRCLNLAIWDPERRRLISFREAERTTLPGV